MRSFKFRLQGLLRLRQVEEDRARGVYQEKLRAVIELREQLAAVEAERHTEIDALVAHGSGHLDLQEILLHRRHLNNLGLRGSHFGVELERCHQEAEAARAVLAEAMQLRKTVERLRERRHAEWQAEHRRAEMAEMDEVAQMRHSRAAAEGGGS